MNRRAIEEHLQHIEDIARQLPAEHDFEAHYAVHCDIPHHIDMIRRELEPWWERLRSGVRGLVRRWTGRPEISDDEIPF